MTKEEAIEIALAEYAYWRRVGEEDDIDGKDRHHMNDICIGAMAAAANIVGALSGIRMEIHHKKADREQAKAAAAFVGSLFGDIAEHDKHHREMKQRISASIRRGGRLQLPPKKSGTPSQ